MVSAIDLGFETDGVKPMIIKLEIAAFPPRLGGSELAYCVGRGERWGDMTELRTILQRESQNS
jgi:hypothetical protein